MDLLKDIARQYWLELLAIPLFVAALARYVRLGAWEDNAHPLAVAALGLLCVLASDEVAEWTGRYGFTRQQWWQLPDTYVRGLGVVALVVGTGMLYVW